jgi:hypothetical protein
MMAAEPFRHNHEFRVEPRDEVLHRTRITLADRRTITATVVNLSPGGLMARSDVDLVAGEWLKIQLPIVGIITAAVRWSLGGRIGCQFDHAVEARTYGQLLAAVS